MAFQQQGVHTSPVICAGIVCRLKLAMILALTVLSSYASQGVCLCASVGSVCQKQGRILSASHDVSFKALEFVTTHTKLPPPGLTPGLCIMFN